MLTLLFGLGFIVLSPFVFKELGRYVLVVDKKGQLKEQTANATVKGIVLLLVYGLCLSVFGYAVLRHEPVEAVPPITFDIDKLSGFLIFFLTLFLILIGYILRELYKIDWRNAIQTGFGKFTALLFALMIFIFCYVGFAIFKLISFL